jgi:Tfp pilus assembly protein PilV
MAHHTHNTKLRPGDSAAFWGIRVAVRSLRRRAFTLAESLIASTILGAAIVGTMGPLCVSQQQTQSMWESSTSMSLARELLEEIAAMPYLDPDGTQRSGPRGTQTTRSQYTSIGDYNGYTDSTSALASMEGTTLSIGCAGAYSRSVKVQYQTTRNGSASGSGNYALVTVTVTAPSKATYTLSRMMTSQKMEF